MKLDLTNKNILITGSATGMGRASALEVAKHGANIAIVDINSEGLSEVSEQLDSLGANYKSFLVDVTSITETEEKINQIVTYAEYSDHKKKNFKVWRGLEHTYRKDWKYSYKLTCFLYSLISYIILIKFNSWMVKLLGG